MVGRLRTLEDLSRPKSGACLDNSETCASVDYDYWIAFMRHVEALVYEHQTGASEEDVGQRGSAVSRHMKEG